MFHPLEHTVAVTSSGIWVLTLLADELGGVRGALSKVIQALRRGGALGCLMFRGCLRSAFSMTGYEATRFFPSRLALYSAASAACSNKV